MRLNKFLNEKKVSIDVYDNPSGETASVRKVGKRFVVDVDKSYDMLFQTKKKLKEWLKSGRYELVGTDLVNEATQPFVLQEYLFGWYDVKFFKTLKEAKTFAQKKYDNTVKRNKKAEKDWRPNAYGKEQIHPMRIVDTTVSPVKYSPATKQDEKDFKSNKKNYLTEQVYTGRTTENNGHSHNYRVDAIGSGFTTFDNTKHIHSIGVWKAKTSQGHEHEILDLQEAKKVVRVQKPDFMVAMGISPDYSVKEIEPDTFHIAKFTHGKEPAEVYRCQWTGKQWKCNCYSRKGSCKHVDIVQKFIKGKKRNVFDKWAREAIPKK